MATLYLSGGGLGRSAHAWPEALRWLAAQPGPLLLASIASDDDRQARTLPVQSEVKVAYDAAQQRITVALPAAHAALARGKINFYRPSDAKLDREAKLLVNTVGEQVLDAKPLRPGLWKIRVQWTIGGEDYYFDQTVVIAPHS